MGKINILEQNVFNMISAGEVVERPSSVVKELVENSIDAGATQIDIYIEEGGIRRIQVSDNGIGILKEDMRKAFLPHATSKLKNIADLDCLSTLGFRGEALASIASVSEVSLISASGGHSSKISLSGGNVVSEMQDSRSQGTIITVDNLFFNTPARLKFLKKPQSEQHYVSDMIKTLMLANPSVGMTLSNESGVILQNEGGNLSDALYSVYGAKTADNLLPLIPNENSYIRVGGYVSKVDYVKPNRTYQTIIVNGRAVEDATIQTAAEKAYSEYLMKRTYPMFVLDVVLPFEDVDANVHPSKTEVRFRDRQAVFSAVYHAVEECISRSVSGTSYGFETKSNAETQNPSTILQTADSTDYAIPSNTDFIQTRINTSRLFGGKTQPKNFAGNIYDISDRNKENTLKDSAVSTFMNEDFTHSFADAQTVCDLKRDLYSKPLNDCADKNFVFEKDSLCNDEISAVFDGKIVGQIFDTYIICERGDLVYIIDQHAAHERILYDSILHKFNVEYKQPLLIPYKLSLTAEEDDYFSKVRSSLEKLGFDIEGEDCSYTVNAVPEPVSNVNFSKFFSDLFANMFDENGLKLETLLKDKLCQQACKAAIKGGESLNRAQIERVIHNYVDENGNLPSKCPHGRPAVIAVSMRDIEKMFKRIV